MDEIKDLILKYELPYRSITGAEATLLFEVYNKITGKSEKDIGCGECREEILRHLYLLYMEQKKIKENGNNSTE